MNFPVQQQQFSICFMVRWSFSSVGSSRLSSTAATRISNAVPLDSIRQEGGKIRHWASRLIHISIMTTITEPKDFAIKGTRGPTKSHHGIRPHRHTSFDLFLALSILYHCCRLAQRSHLDSVVLTSTKEDNDLYINGHKCVAVLDPTNGTDITFLTDTNRFGRAMRKGD